MTKDLENNLIEFHEYDKKQIEIPLTMQKSEVFHKIKCRLL